MIVARSDHPIDDSLKEKIALFCDVEKRAVIPMVTTQILYEVPLLLEEANVAELVLERLGLEPRATPNWKSWENMLQEINRPKPKAKVALIGKYVELHDAYMSVREALKHAALQVGVELDLEWIHSSDLEKGQCWDILETVDGIIVPGVLAVVVSKGKFKQPGSRARTKSPILVSV